MRKSVVPTLFIILLVAALPWACASSPRKRRAPEASFAEVKDDPSGGIILELDAAKSGDFIFRLTYPDLGPVAIKGAADREGNGWLLKFESLDWFSAWANGWTEASFILEGESSLQPEPAGDAWVLSLRSMPKLDAVRYAAIRYYDTYVRGQQGIEEFSHRWDRIQATCRALLRSFDGPALARRPDAITRYLFPEVYGYDAPPAPGFKTVFGRGQEWNADYSLGHFPEALRTIRDDGTMLRDYKESPGLWQLALSWDDFWEHRGYTAGLRRLSLSQ